MKRRLKYPLIVEGKYDKATLSNLVEGEILLTDGFHIYKNKEMLSLLRQLAQNGPVAVLTDSDRAGFSIRGHLAGAIPPERLIQVYIPEIYGKERRKTAPSAEGKLGVEGMPPEILLSILEQAGLLEDSEVPCPAAITVLLICIQLKAFTLGATMVLCFSLGLALTLVTVGVGAAISVQQAAKRWSGFNTLARKAPYFSSALIAMVGLYMGIHGYMGIVG